MIDMSNATSLRDKLEICDAHADCSNTNLKAVFDLILSTAISNNLEQNELPKNILIVSDMEFDSMMGIYSRWGSFNQEGSSTKLVGINCGRVSSTWIYIAKINFLECMFKNQYDSTQGKMKAGVALVSGFNPAVYNMVLSNELDPYKCLLAQINSERYAAIEEAFIA